MAVTYGRSHATYLLEWPAGSGNLLTIDFNNDGDELDPAFGTTVESFSTGD